MVDDFVSGCRLGVDGLIVRIEPPVLFAAIGMTIGAPDSSPCEVVDSGRFLTFTARQYGALWPCPSRQPTPWFFAEPIFDSLLQFVPIDYLHLDLLKNVRLLLL